MNTLLLPAIAALLERAAPFIMLMELQYVLLLERRGVLICDVKYVNIKLMIIISNKIKQ
jgi:hypothetical protein